MGAGNREGGKWLDRGWRGEGVGEGGIMTGGEWIGIWIWQAERGLADQVCRARSLILAKNPLSLKIERN